MSESVSKTFPVDLRAIVRRSYGDVIPIPNSQVPGGSLMQRVGAVPSELHAAELVVPPHGEGQGRAVSNREYWSLALPCFFLVHGPLEALARADMDHEERLSAEASVLKLYNDTYGGLPLPMEVILVLKERVQNASTEGLIAWLDEARQEILSSWTVANAATMRAHYRRLAVLRGATGTWSERSTALAEFMSDLFLLARAALEDVRSAMEQPINGSVSVSLQKAVDQGRCCVEAVLQSLTRPGLSAADFLPRDREAVKTFAEQRPPYERHGLIYSALLPPASAKVKPPEDTPSGSSVSETQAKPASPAPDDARSTFQNLLARLQRDLGDQSHCAELALIGTAHMNGLHERLLIVGRTGTGKSRSAMALAEAMDVFHTCTDCADLSPVSFRGASAADVLSDALGQGRENGIWVLEEVDKLRIAEGLTGVSREARESVQTTLLACLDGRIVTPDYGKPVSTNHCLIIGTGAFADRFNDRPPSTQELVEWGFIREFAARWTARVCVQSPDHYRAIALLRTGGRSVLQRLQPLAELLGVTIEVPDHVLSYVAHRWLSDGADYRTAAEWVVSAARRKIIEVMCNDGDPRIILSGDDLMIDRTSREDTRS